ncbi:MAG: hypothetical protein FWH24_04045 [Oscillospiraceae bacterium]|nr:hypothetical protein [Oscillospiraceae bacterium]
MKKLHKFIYVSYPVLAALGYTLISIIFNAWHPAWLIFLTVPIYYMLVEFNRRRNWNVFPYPILCVVLYLTAGFDYNLWHPMWVIFLTVPIYYIAINIKAN